MAPEAWREEKNTYKMDVYSIGLVFYQILTLNHPLVSFVGDPTDWVRWRAVHLSQACPDVRNARPDSPLALAKLVMRMTDKSPGNRPSWDEVLSALDIPTVTPPGTQPIDPQLMAAMKGLADQRFRQEQKKTEAELARDREAERNQARSQEFDQSSRRLLVQFDGVIQALNEQEPTYPIKIDGDGVRSRNYTLPNGRKLTCQLFGLTKKLEKPAIGAGYLGVNGGLSANLMLSGQEDDIASGHWSAVEANVMALIYGQTELKLLREAGLPDETIRFVLRMDGNERKVANPQGAQSLADKVRITRAIKDIEFFSEPFQMHQGGGNGNLAVLFIVVIIRNRGPLRDVAHAPDDARAREHRLAQRRLPGRRVTHDGKIPKIPCRRRGHKSNSFLL